MMMLLGMPPEGRKARGPARGVNVETPIPRLGENLIGLLVRVFVSLCGTFLPSRSLWGLGAIARTDPVIAGYSLPFRLE
jgi:hypothetical protein